MSSGNIPFLTFIPMGYGRDSREVLQSVSMVSREVRDYLRAHMARHDWTQAKLAEAIRTTQSKVSKILNGENRLSLDVFVLICHAMGLEPDTVLARALGTAPARVRLSPDELQQLDEYRRLSDQGRAYVVHALHAQTAMEIGAQHPPSKQDGRKAVV